MTREEEIKQAAYSQYCNSESICFTLMCDSFKQGAKWADKNPINVWHDASEEPKEANWKILCQDKHGGCWVENRIDAQLLHKNWDAYTEIEKIVRWAYIKDLLPKGGEQ